MANIVLNHSGNTYTDPFNPDSNFLGTDRLYYGECQPSLSSGESLNNRRDNKSYIFFDASELKYKSIKKLVFKGRVYESFERINVGAVGPGYSEGLFQSTSSAETNNLDIRIKTYWSDGNYAGIATYNKEPTVIGEIIGTRIQQTKNKGDYFTAELGFDLNIGYQWLCVEVSTVIKAGTTDFDTLTRSNVGSFGSLYADSCSLEVEYEDYVPSINIDDMSSNLYNSSEDVLINWLYSCDKNIPQAYLEIGWSSDNINWNRLYLGEWTEQSYIIPANTLPGGIIYLCARVASIDNVWSEYIYTTFNIEENIPVVTPTYPLDVNVSNSSNVIFTWDYTEPLEVGQNLYVLSWSSDNGIAWNDIAQMSSEHYCEVPADTFPVGNILWKIKVTNNHGKTSAESMARFTAIGQTDAPTIISVSNSAIPEVTWASEFQDAYEVRLRQNSEIIYESGLQTGADVRSHKCNVILENGIYTAEVRVLNTYGYYSEWSTYGFILDLPSPDAPQNVFVSLNNRYGIDISGDINAGDTGYVVRRESSDDTPVVLAEYTGEFTDYKAALNKVYQYTLRSVGDMTSGYADGEWIDATVSLNDTVLLHDINDMSSFVMLSCSDEQFDIVRNDSLTKTLRQCIGRVYPVKEQMDWIVTTRKFTAWVSNEDYNKLLGMSTAYYRADGEAFLCDLEISDGGKYIGGGRIVKFVVTRLDEDLEVML